MFLKKGMKMTKNEYIFKNIKYIKHTNIKD